MEAGSPPRLAVEWLAVGTPANRATWPKNGSAADLINLAMVRIDAALETGGHQTAMLLQVQTNQLARRQ